MICTEALLDSRARSVEELDRIRRAFANHPEIGDITRFEDVDQLLAYANVHPAERSSGRKGADRETSWHMSKAGNAHLRAAA